MRHAGSFRGLGFRGLGFRVPGPFGDLHGSLVVFGEQGVAKSKPQVNERSFDGSCYVLCSRCPYFGVLRRGSQVVTSDIDIEDPIA